MIVIASIFTTLIMLQVKQFQETLKESIAEERSACQDRVDRRAIRDRLEWGARQEARDGQLRQEISGWLQVGSCYVSCSSPTRHYLLITGYHR